MATLRMTSRICSWPATTLLLGAAALLAAGGPGGCIITQDPDDTAGNEDGNGTPSGCAGDRDCDGLNDTLEATLGTDPDDPDTDRDGLLDGEEVGGYPRELDAPPDQDGDGVPDVRESRIDDADRDGAADQIDGPGPYGDLDGDGVLNGQDNCPQAYNRDQADMDLDGKGDVCDDEDDADGDRVIDVRDNCPEVFNPDQANNDHDLAGDVCDPDDDQDGLSDSDELALGTNPWRADSDGDGLLDGEEVGGDPARPRDTDGDGIIEALEAWNRDSDGDGVADSMDGPGPGGDLDGDGVANGEDLCPQVADPDQTDTDGDELGDACDDDDDDDGLPDLVELYLGTDPRRRDTDSDGLDDRTEARLGTDPTLPDTDGDGVRDAEEVGPDPSLPRDTDGDGIIDALESSLRDSDLDGSPDQYDGPAPGADADGDGIANEDDVCPGHHDPLQIDTDGDNLGDACDDDDDHDWVNDATELLWGTNPLDPDTDGDEVPDGDELGDLGLTGMAPDEDGDGRIDALESRTRDSDGDGVADQYDPVCGP